MQEVGQTSGVGYASSCQAGRGFRTCRIAIFRIGTSYVDANNADDSYDV